MKNIFIVWTKYQSRVEGIVEDLKEFIGDIEIVYRDNPPANKFKKIIQYIRYGIADFQLLKRNSVKHIFVQLPPTYSLIAPLLFKRLFRSDVQIIADCHNAMTRNPWLTRFGTQYLLKRADALILHNFVVYERRKNFFPFIDNSKISYLEDKTASKLSYKQNNASININHPFVFIPSSFNLDEPVNALIEAARLLPKVNFVITGNTGKMEKNFHIKKSKTPDNVFFTGWLTHDEYYYFLHESDILIGLTIYDDIQMSVSNEGLAAEKVMILSDKAALREIYKDGAMYTKNDSLSIKNAIELALANREDFSEKIKIVKEQKQNRYRQQINNLIILLSR